MVEFREFTLTRTWACWEIASPALYADDGLPDDFCQIEARDDVLRVSLRRADLETPGTASKPPSEDR